MSDDICRKWQWKIVWECQCFINYKEFLKLKVNEDVLRLKSRIILDMYVYFNISQKEADLNYTEKNLKN